jgi:hypothetical protein
LEQKYPWVQIFFFFPPIPWHTPSANVFSTDHFRVATASGLGFATRAIFICFWLEDAWFWRRRSSLFSRWLLPEHAQV